MLYSPMGLHMRHYNTSGYHTLYMHVNFAADNTHTKRITKLTRPSGVHVKYFKSYLCQHASFNKAEKPKEKRNDRQRNHDCQSAIRARLFDTAKPSYRNWPTEFRISFVHSHSEVLESESNSEFMNFWSHIKLCCLLFYGDAYRSIRRISNTSRCCIIGMFKNA